MFFYIPVRQLTEKLRFLAIAVDYLTHTTPVGQAGHPLSELLCVFYIPINQSTKQLRFLAIALQLLSYTPPPWGKQVIPWLRVLYVPYSRQSITKR